MELQIRVVTLLAIAVLAAMGTAAFALLSATQKIPNTGNISAIGVGVYWDSDCNDKVSFISWGSLGPGETKDIGFYILNEGNVAIVLSMTSDNWNSTEAFNFITLEWDREGYMLISGSSIHAVLTLSISSTISEVEGFSFDTIVTGTETLS